MRDSSSSTTPAELVVATSQVVFLSVNDMYKLLPSDEGQGGMAQFATLLDQTKTGIPTDAHVVVTLNGDFLWRTELERSYKAEMMIDVLHELGIQYVVLGNHEFDFGAQRCLDLLPSMDFTVFGSNARRRENSSELLSGVTDYEIVTLAGGIKMGMFGVLTSNPFEFVTPNDPLVVFESEVEHSKRCVRALQAAGADVIVALTHTRLAKDRLIARQVPGIHLILGGHDHEPSTLFEKTTMIHKSGCDALWLAQIDMVITKETSDGDSHVDVQFGWKMLPNRGCIAKPSVQKLLDAFFAKVASEPNAPEMEATLATSRVWLDGSRVTMRSQESNLGNLVADAIRVGMQADVAFINGGFIQGERKYRRGLRLTRSWLREVLPISNTARCVALTAESLRHAFLSYLQKYPDETSMMPHVSGVFVVFSIGAGNNRALRLFHDRGHMREIADSAVLRVACTPFVFDEADGSEHFQASETISDGPVVRELVAAFVAALPNAEVAYASREGRFAIREESPSRGRA